MKDAPAPSPPSTSHEHAALLGVARGLQRLEVRMRELEAEMRASLAAVPEDHRESARNLAHYVALREQDLRAMQSELSQLGLSSLGRCEGFVLGSLIEVSLRAHEALSMLGDPHAAAECARLRAARGEAFGWATARTYLHRHTREVLGPRPEDRHIYVMVTAPSAREADAAWMRTLLRAGMNVLRINCAHEDAAAWQRTVDALREAQRETGKECRVLMDLAGPKIRTGPMSGAGAVVTWKVPRDELGRAVAPARVSLLRASTPLPEGSASTLRLADAEADVIAEGDELRFRDARGKRRTLAVVALGPGGIEAHARKRGYVVAGTRARILRDGARVADVTLDVDAGASPGLDVRVGDPLVLTARRVRGRSPRRDATGGAVRPGIIACTLPDALELLAEGHRVLFDEGRIEAVVERVDAKRRDHHLRVVRTQKASIKLRAEKGINLPDTVTKVPALTDDDRRALEFVVAHADAVSLSFVRTPEDVRALQDALDGAGRTDVGVVLKIETRAGFENLPRLLLQGLRRPPLAVMIARGDLAVEVGFERLAELQEEILWLCEASHVPTIWATQVLDTLARTGVPSRAEVTDAATSVAAECVMLNKGPFIAEAVRVLSNILRRMEKHHDKKRSLFRRLQVSTFGAR